MPEQGTAAAEQTIAWDIESLSDGSREDLLASIERAEFPVALRGYDRDAVDAFLADLSSAVARLGASRMPSAAVRTAVERVGEEVSGILGKAHETADQVTADSRREAEDRLQKARVEAREITARAKQRLADLDAETDRIWAERDRIIDDARQLSQQLLQLVNEAAQRFPAEEGPTEEGLMDEGGSKSETEVMPSTEAQGVEANAVEARAEPGEGIAIDPDGESAAASGGEEE